MIRYVKRFWSECFAGDAPTPYARLHIYRLVLSTGVIGFFVAGVCVGFGGHFVSHFLIKK